MPQVNPQTWTMSVKEVEFLPFDPTPLLGDGQTTINPSAELINLDTQAVITLAFAPTLNGNQIDQQVSGPTDLVHPGNYRLTLTFTCSPSSNVRALWLKIIATP